MKAGEYLTDEERERFARVCRQTIAWEHERAGIGTLSEKLLHASVKTFLSPDPTQREVKVGQYVADIREENGHIFEIQTQGFSHLRKKLDAFLKDSPVTVVYPYPLTRYSVTISPETGEVTPKKKSTRPGKPLLIFRELYAIKPCLTHPNLSVLVLMPEITEYRIPGKNAKTPRQKRSTYRYERIPSRLEDAVWLSSPADYADLLPPGLPSPFGVREVAALARIRPREAQIALNVMAHVGAVNFVGKEGQRYLYVIAEMSEEEKPQKDEKKFF